MTVHLFLHGTWSEISIDLLLKSASLSITDESFSASVEFFLVARCKEGEPEGDI